MSEGHPGPPPPPTPAPAPMPVVVSGKVELDTSGRVDIYLHEVPEFQRLTIRIAPPGRRAGVHGGPNVATVVQITDEQQADVAYDFTNAKDAAGNAAPLDPASVVSVAAIDNPAVVSATVNGNVVTVSSENAVDAASVGQAQVSVVITPPTGDPLTDVIAVTVVPSAATQISGSVGTPTARS